MNLKIFLKMLAGAAVTAVLWGVLLWLPGEVSMFFLRAAVIGFVGAAGLALYLVPSIVAGRREHPQMVPILLLNVCLGWTFLGWLGALIWASANWGKAEG